MADEDPDPLIGANSPDQTVPSPLIHVVGWFIQHQKVGTDGHGTSHLKTS